jgi:hypothetical protein
MRSRWTRCKRWVAEHGVGVAAGVALVGIVTLLVLQLVQGPPDSTTLVLAAAVGTLLFGLLAPAESSRFFQRMTNLKVAGVLEIGLEKVIRAETVRPPGDESDQVVARRGSEDYDEIVKELKTKLRFVHAITHMHDRVPRQDEYRQITFTLAAEGLLRDDEPQFVLDLISGRDLGVEALPEKPKAEFLDAAWSFAARLGFVIWDRFVRDELTNRGWVVADFQQGKGHRPDFLAYWEAAGKWALMSARVGEVEEPFPYPRVRDRLESAEVNVPVDGRCIVVPAPHPTVKQRVRLATVVKDGKGTESEVKVLRLQGSLLEHPERAFDDCNEDDVRCPR